MDNEHTVVQYSVLRSNNVLKDISQMSLPPLRFEIIQCL